jgi:Na+/proline symporter
MITAYDDFILVFYFVFVLAIGFVFRRLSKNTSDYFRAGGSMPWWITGTSAWIAGFSAWTFTGAAGKVYSSGTMVIVLYYASLFALAVVLGSTCILFRRLRVVSWMEAVRSRFGTLNEQLYTWLKLPLTLLYSGIGLNAIGVFVSSVFHVQITPVLVILGVAVTVIAVTGGSFAVLASDFVQMLLVVTITIVVSILALHEPAVGGIAGLIHKAPSYEFHWTDLVHVQIVWIYIAVMLWNQFSAANNMENATMYLMTKSDRDARRMVLIPLLGTLVGPLIWFIPPMVATITHPHIGQQFPNLKNPQEASFVAVCMDVMPQGLLGLLLCSMLGATVTSMDAGLNKGAGVFVRSFWLPIVDPHCNEKRLLMVSKLCSLIFGVIIVATAIEFNRFRTMELFDLVNQLAASLGGPLALPLIWGLFFKRTPAWSAWSTTLVGFIVSWYVNTHVDPIWFQHLMGWRHGLSKDEATDLLLAETALGTMVIGSAWFFATSLFYSSSPLEHKSRVDELFVRLKTPVDRGGEVQVEQQDHVIYQLLGGLCLVYGTFVLLLLLIPNQITGRLCFVFVGGIVFGVGAVLTSLAKKMMRTHRASESTTLKNEPVIEEDSVHS